MSSTFRPGALYSPIFAAGSALFLCMLRTTRSWSRCVLLEAWHNTPPARISVGQCSPGGTLRTTRCARSQRLSGPPCPASFVVAMTDTPATSGPAAAAAHGLYRKLLPTIAVLSAGTVMTIFDATIVNVGIDTLGRDLHLSLTSAQWVSTAYLLTLAFTVPLTGWATGRLGTKRLWLVALSAFLLGSTLCGLAWSPASLIAFRVLQGAGGGMIMPVGQAIIVQRVPPQQLGRVMGVLTMPLLLGPVLGPVIGGIILTHLSWRWMFFVNIPLGVPTLLFAAQVLRREPPPDRHALDLRGLALLSPGLVLVVFGLSQIGDGAVGGVSALSVATACSRPDDDCLVRNLRARARPPSSPRRRRCSESLSFAPRQRSHSRLGFSCTEGSSFSPPLSGGPGPVGAPRGSRHGAPRNWLGGRSAGRGPPERPPRRRLRGAGRLMRDLGKHRSARPHRREHCVGHTGWCAVLPRHGASVGDDPRIRCGLLDSRA